MKKIDETAAAGSTGAGSIAVAPSRSLDGAQSRMSLKDFMGKFYKGVKNAYAPKDVSKMFTSSINKIDESANFEYQLDNATSTFKAAQGESGHEMSDTIAYGVQDDDGNIMVITIPIEQSEDLERTVAQTLADVMQYKKTGRGENKSLAELLYDLKDNFNIIDAQFPTIPKDAVYNADEITSSLPENDSMGDDEDMGDDDFGSEGDMGDEETDNMDPSIDGGDDMEDGDGDDDDFDPDDEDMGDDFGDGEEDKESLLVSVLGMLKSQNEKETAQANAEIEKAKAVQAKAALTSSKMEMEAQEDMVAAQAEMDAEKEKEKRAKELANIAKFNYKKKKGLGEGFSNTFKSIVMEIDPNDTVATVRKQMQVVPLKYAIDPGDSEETKSLKNKEKQLAMRELQIKLRAARNRATYDKTQQDQEQDQEQNPDDLDQNNQNNQNNRNGEI